MEKEGNTVLTYSRFCRFGYWLMEDLFFVTWMLHMFYHHAKKVMILDLDSDLSVISRNFDIKAWIFALFQRNCLFMVYLMTLSVDDYATLIFEKINCILHYRNSQGV